MSEPNEDTPGPYGQTFRSVRRRPGSEGGRPLGANPTQSYGLSFSSIRDSRDSEGGGAFSNEAAHTYGQTFRSVRRRPGSEVGPALPNNTPLLPKGIRKPRHPSPRLPAFDYVGPYAYSITINTDGGRKYLTEARFVGFCIRALEEIAATYAFEPLAYCFMPNHVHLLTQGLTEASRLKPFIKQFEQITGFAFKQELCVQLWHRSYHDHVLRKEEDIYSVAAYIWGNPVRAGLVESAEDYPYSGPERLLGEVGSTGDQAAVGGQSLSSVRTITGPSADQA